MPKNNKNTDRGDNDYKAALHGLQVELVKLQRHVIASGGRILVIVEGRDAGGKDGVIKRIIEHLSPRETRVVALGKPSDRERTTWYFQRFTPHLPAAQEIVLFNRSWYNRAGVEPVMGFCTGEEHQEFLETVQSYEQMLVRSGVRLFKYYLDISRDVQKRRLDERREDPLKQWKISPIDEAAQKRWDDYSRARNVMFARTHHADGPWNVVRADDKWPARINLIKDLLFRLDYDEKDEKLLITDPNVVFKYAESYLRNGMIAE
ncbi:MAG: polyphosphate kinase 2 [Planctomycetales bacterium]